MLIALIGGTLCFAVWGYFAKALFLRFYKTKQFFALFAATFVYFSIARFIGEEWAAVANSPLANEGFLLVVKEVAYFGAMSAFVYYFLLYWFEKGPAKKT